MSFTIISIGEIISDATQELYAITNAATARIDAMEAKVRGISKPSQNESDSGAA